MPKMNKNKLHTIQKNPIKWDKGYQHLCLSSDIFKEKLKFGPDKETEHVVYGHH